MKKINTKWFKKLDRSGKKHVREMGWKTLREIKDTIENQRKVDSGIICWECKHIAHILNL